MPVTWQFCFSVVKHNECAKLYDRFSDTLRPEDPVKIYGNNLCATRPDKLGDVCQGDSGGSLAFSNANGRHEVIGVVSYGFGCGSEFEGRSNEGISLFRIFHGYNQSLRGKSGFG